MKMTDAVILVGGKGTRLGELTKITPKPLLKIGNKTFVEILLSKLIKYQFNKIYLLCSFKKEKFFKLYNNKFFHNSKVICINEGKPKDTGGALFNLKKKIKKNFFLLNGDTYFDFDLNILSKSKDRNPICTIAVTKNNKKNQNLKMNHLSIKRDGSIKLSNTKSNLMNGGVYYLNKKIFRFIKNSKISLENEIFPKLIKKNELKGIFLKSRFIDIGNKKNLEYVRKKNDYLKQKAVFLDRDGVINQLKKDGYIKNFKEFKFLKGVVDGIKFLNTNNFLVIIVTNQSCVGKSIITEKQLINIHLKMQKYLENKNKSYVDDIFYSPYYKFSRFKKFRLNKIDRKPNSGMLIKAIKKWNIDINKSFLIGDQKTDYLAAKNIGLKFFYKNDYPLVNQLKRIIL